MKLFSILLCSLFLNTAVFAQDAITPVQFVSGPDLNTFPITTTITQISVSLTGVEAQFGKRDGPNRWPDNTTPGWSGPLQYSMGVCERINESWYCSAPIETWYGANVIGGPIQSQDPPQISKNWFYDGRWSPLDGHQPAPGDKLGLFVVAGDARNSYNPVKERSNIVLITLPAPNTTAVYAFGAPVVNPSPDPAPTPLPVPSPSPVPPINPPTLGGLERCLASMDILQASVAVLQTDVQAGRAENQAFYAETRTLWETIKGPLLKFVVPALTAFVAGKAL